MLSSISQCGAPDAAFREEHHANFMRLLRSPRLPRRARRDRRRAGRSRTRADAHRRQAVPHRHPSSSVVARLHRRDFRTADRADPADAMDAGEVPGRYGQGRRRHLDRVDQRARRVLRQLRRRAGAGARMQRVWREADRRPSRPLRPVRHRAAAGRRGRAARNRLRARHAQGRRHLHDDRLPRQIPRRSGVHTGDGRTQPAQGRLFIPIRTATTAASI